MNQKQFKKQYPTASFDMMAEEAIASAELAGANSEKNWEKELDEKFGDFYATGWGGEKCYCNTLLKQFISAQIAKAKQEGAKEMLKIISEDFGWKSIKKYYLNKIKL